MTLKEDLIERIWAQAEPDLNWYSNMVQKLLEDMPEEKLADMVAQMEDED